MSRRDFPPIHPGETLSEDILKPLGISPYAAAKRMRVPRTRVERIIRGETSISADTALRLERAFGPPARFWLNLQNGYDLEVALDHQTDLDSIERVADITDQAA